MTAAEVLSTVRITKVYHDLGGPVVRHGRGPAFWRDGDGLNVALNDRTGTWYDFVTHEHGGILDLVHRVNGGSRREALRWVADSRGLELDEPSPEQRRAHKLQRQQDRSDLPAARSWRRASLMLCEELLKTMASNDRRRFDVTQFAVSLRVMGDRDLLTEYRWQHVEHPDLTKPIIAVMEVIENAEANALIRFILQGRQE